jgi:transcriptional regulator with XRE-family HTH domain
LSKGRVRVLAVVERAVDPVAMRLGEGLRAARTIAGVNQRELARRLEVPPNYISRWETGTRRLELETIERAERVMDLQPGTVFRSAGYVKDDDLNLGSLDPAAQRAIRAILAAFAPPDEGTQDGSG